MPDELSRMQRRCFDLRQRGMSFRRIAEIVRRDEGVSEDLAVKTVEYHVQEARVKLGLRRHATTAHERSAESMRILAMHQEGLDRHEIAAIVGKTPGAVRHVIQRFVNPYERKPRTAKRQEEQPHVSAREIHDKMAGRTYRDVDKDVLENERLRGFRYW